MTPFFYNSQNIFKMKNIFKIALTLAFACVVSFTQWSCAEDKCDSVSVWTQWEPVYKTSEEIRNSVKVLPVQALKNPGKIYFYDRYLLINEIGEGIHVIDNSNQSAPRPLCFLSIAGNADMAVKDGILYADNYIDMVVFDLSNATAPRLINRVESVFVDIYAFDRSNNRFIVSYAPKQVEYTGKCNDPKYYQSGNYWYEKSAIAFNDVNAGAGNTGRPTSSIPAVANIAGSFSRFCTVGNYLYTVSSTGLRVFNVSAATQPSVGAQVNLGWNIETIFPYKDKLFVGSNTTLFMLDNRNPAQPAFSQSSTFTHARGCDPVVVEDDIAYVTVHSNNTTCPTLNNELHIIDVRDINQARTIKNYPMTNPKGLSILNKTLYLCDDGLKIFDATNANAIDQNLLAHIKNVKTYDVIVYPQANNKVSMLLIGPDGFFQYDVTNPRQPQELSRLAIVK